MAAHDDILDACSYLISLMEKPMGCDIHCYSESRINGRWTADKASTRTEEDGWISLEKSYHGRNYSLFGLLNQVRTEWPWSFSEQAEIPQDASDEIAELRHQWEGDAHSDGSLTVRELKEKATELMLESDDDARNLCTYLLELIRALPDTGVSPDDQRIVFWFDN